MNSTYSTRIIRHFILSLSLCIIFNSCIKQMARSRHDSSISTEQIQRFKERTAILVLPRSEYSHLDDYKELIPKVWTITPIEVIKYNDLGKYASSADKYAFFEIGGIKTTTTSNTGSYSNTHFYITLSVPYGASAKKKKVKVKTDDLCRIELYPNMPTTMTRFGKDVSDDLYMNGEFRNFTVPYMMTYLKIVQKNLQNSKNPWVYENYTDAALRQRLLRDTLYIPDSLVYNRNKFTGKEKEKEENFFQSYGGKYKIISNTELIALAKNRSSSKPLFLFEYVLSSTDKYVGVLELNSGTIVYRKYTPASYNLKSKDIKDIID
jgi:hypothetical protein